jgi:hypothetical protein
MDRARTIQEIIRFMRAPEVLHPSIKRRLKELDDIKLEKQFYHWQEVYHIPAGDRRRENMKRHPELNHLKNPDGTWRD